VHHLVLAQRELLHAAHLQRSRQWNGSAQQARGAGRHACGRAGRSKRLQWLRRGQVR
jgi:hypothetical protein